MAENFYIGKTREWLHTRLSEVSDQLALGPTSSIKSGTSQQVDFDTSKLDLKTVYGDLCTAIVNHPDFDADDPIDAACASRSNQRRMSISTVYPGTFGNL